MSREQAYLFDILDAARLALSYVANKTRDESLTDTQCQDAVIRRIEINGEAARRVPDYAQKTLPQLPWGAMIGMRNVMIHDYDTVDLTIVWDTVQRDLPVLVTEIEKLLPS